MGYVTTKRLRAFTLQELLVVLIIIGILTLLVLPNLLPMITKAKSPPSSASLQLVLFMLVSIHWRTYYAWPPAGGVYLLYDINVRLIKEEVWKKGKMQKERSFNSWGKV